METQKMKKTKVVLFMMIIGLYVCQAANCWAHHELWVQYSNCRKENIELHQEMQSLREGIRQPLEEILGFLKNYTAH